MLPHLVGNCQQDSALQSDLWLQMGADHCIRIHRDLKKSWIKAEQQCEKSSDGKQQKAHLIALHNRLDEKLVQNLVFNR